MNRKIPVLLDTDIGTDIDDALCLTYLLAHPQCELLGVTTVTGEAEKRAMLADALCQAAGRTDVPIHSGSSDALLIPMQQDRCQQAEVLPRWKHRSDFPSNTAVEFLHNSIKNRPGEITLLAVGPLTNIALLFALYPETATMLKSLVLMGGTFMKGGPGGKEWNALVDPHATALVYQAPVNSHISIGLDVTTHCTLDSATCRERLRGGPLDLVREAAEVWFRRTDQITFHDPLAAAVIFEPSLCSYVSGHVEVELQSTRMSGATLWNPSGSPVHRIASEVNSERFFKHYFEIVSDG